MVLGTAANNAGLKSTHLIRPVLHDLSDANYALLINRFPVLQPTT